MLGSKALLVNCERAAIERLGLGQPVGGPEQLGEVVEVCGDFTMLGSEALLVNCKSAAHQRLGLGEPVGALEQRSQVVECSGDVGMILSVAAFHRVGIALGQGDCFGVFACAVEFDYPLVES